MTLVFAKNFSGLENSISHTNIIYNTEGSSWGAVNQNQEVLFCWIVTTAGNNNVIGRVDGRGFDDNTLAFPTLLSTTAGASGVRCCYNPNSNGWIVLYNVGSTLYYRTFDRDLTNPSTETQLPNGTSTFYNLGCTDNGYFFVSWVGRIIKIRASDGTVVHNFYIDGGEKMFVHQDSGFIDVTRIYNNKLFVDRFDSYPLFRYSVTVEESSVISKHDITGRYGNDGFFITYLDDTTGDNIKYRAFSATGTPLYDTKIISGTGHIDTAEAHLHCHIGEITGIDDQWHTYTIRAVSNGSNRVLALIEPQNFNPQYIDGQEYINMSDSNTQYPQPIVSPSQFELRSLKPNLIGTPSMDLEVYTRQSVWTGLWRVENNARVFVNEIYDFDAKAYIENSYSQYPGGNRLVGTTGTTDADYIASPGRDTVDPNTTTFSGYWGTTTDEDNVFIGGPKLSEIVASAEDNNQNCFAAQISFLAGELGFSTFKFITTNRNHGWRHRDRTPELNLTINSVLSRIQRHWLPPTLWYQINSDAHNSVDYGVIIRLPLTTTSNQSERAMVYIAGINNIGTKAAAYVYQNPLAYKLGSSLAHLVVLEYDQAILDAGGWTAGSTGNLRVYPLKIAITSNPPFDFEYGGMR